MNNPMDRDIDRDFLKTKDILENISDSETLFQSYEETGGISKSSAVNLIKLGGSLLVDFVPFGRLIIDSVNLTSEAVEISRTLGDELFGSRSKTAISRVRLKQVEQLRRSASKNDLSACTQLAAHLIRTHSSKGDLVEAVKLLDLAAEQGYGKAQLYLGHVYERYAHPNVDDAETSDQLAARWYTDAHEQGIAEASFALATLFGQKRGLKLYTFEDLNLEIVELYRASVLKGLSIAKRSLALAYVEYFTSQLFENKDAAINEATQLLGAMAREGSARAFTDLGLLALRNRDQSEEANRKISFDWIERGAQLRDPEGLLHLGHLYRKGYGPAGLNQDERDIRAVTAYTEAQNYGHKLAAISLADLFFKRRPSASSMPLSYRVLSVCHPKKLLGGAKLHDIAALRSIKSGLRKKEAPAQFVWGTMLLEGGVVTRNEAAAVDYLEMAAAQNHAPAIFTVGALYSEGKVVSSDKVEAFHHFRRAARMGVDRAQHNLALMYRDGVGTKADANRAAKWILRAASQGLADSQNVLAGFYLDGFGVEKCEASACSWFEKALQQGHLEAKNNVGAMHLNGLVENSDPAFGFKLIESAAEAGMAGAMTNLGVAYLNGNGAELDIGRAICWLERGAVSDLRAVESLTRVYSNKNLPEYSSKDLFRWAKLGAEMGSGACQNSLGFCYAEGAGVDPDLAMAAKLFKQAADSGNPYGCLNLGQLFAHGNGVTRDHRLAYNWYMKAADDELPEAYHGLGWLLKNSDQIDRNEEAAISWLKKSANAKYKKSYNLLAGHYWSMGEEYNSESFHWFEKIANTDDPDAQFLLAASYESGIRVDIDLKRAIYWYVKSSRLHHARSIYRIGRLYQTGNGLKRDFKRSFKWIKRAAKLGYDEAENSLGAIYLDGLGVPKDYSKALFWIKRSIEQGCSSAHSNLGAVYYLGLGVQKDLDLARKHFEIAAKDNIDTALHNLGTIYLAGDGVDADEAKAFRYFKQAADLGESNAQYKVGRMYLLGNYVEQNDVDAANWFEKAAKKGNKNACMTLGMMCRDGQGVEKNLQLAEKYFIAAGDDLSGPLKELALLYQASKNLDPSGEKALRAFVKAGELGDVDCQYRVGQLFRDANGTSKRMNMSRKWFRIASSNGHRAAPNALGIMYLNGDGIKKSFKKAFEYFEMGAQRGHSEAQYNLASMLHAGLIGSVELNRAAKLFDTAAAQGQPDAQVAIAKFQLAGLAGYKKDQQAGMSKLRELSAKDNGNAMAVLGSVLLNGELGIEPNPEEGINWLMRASDKGNAQAYYGLAIAYLMGLGGAQDDDEALEYLHKAADNGVDAAKCTLIMHYVDEGDLDRAHQYFKEINRNDPIVQLYIGMFYADGLLVDRSLETAAKWIEKSVKNGNVGAISALESVQQELYKGA